MAGHGDLRVSGGAARHARGGGIGRAGGGNEQRLDVAEMPRDLCRRAERGEGEDGRRGRDSPVTERSLGPGGGDGDDLARRHWRDLGTSWRRREADTAAAASKPCPWRQSGGREIWEVEEGGRKRRRAARASLVAVVSMLTARQRVEGDEDEVRSRAPACTATGQRGGAWPA